MKNLFSKNMLIGALVAVNVCTAAILANKSRNGDARPTKDLPKKAIVQPAAFKGSGELQGCYEAFLAREPEVDEGAVVVHWRIGQDGQIEFLKMVHSDLEDEAFKACVIDKIKAARFTETHGGALVAHTFNFHRKDPGHLEF